MAGQNPNMDQFEAYFQRADVDRDGRISGSEAVNFLLASNLPRQVLAQIWTFADKNRLGFLGRQEFYNALKLVTVAQSKRDLTKEVVEAALNGPAASKIPPPQINLGLLIPQPNARANPSPVQLAGSSSPLPGISVSSQQALLTQPNQVMRPPQPLPPSSGFQSHPIVATHGMPETGLITSSPPTNSFDSLGGSVNGSQAGISSQGNNRNLIPSATQGVFGQTVSPMTQPKAPEISGPLQSASATLSTTGNGLPSDSVFGDVFSAASFQPQQNSSGPAYPTSSGPVSSMGNSVLSRDQPSVKPSVVSQPPTTQAQQVQSAGKASQHVSAHKPPLFPPAAGHHPPAVGHHLPAAGHHPPAAGQSKGPWPRITQSDVQKYGKVFVQVDTDRDGKITGDQARKLFLSWKLPREVLKQVWDLSDEDNDSMLSLREFCVALYLMERYREGRHLPTVLPHSFILDETLFAAPSQPTAVHGVTSLRPPSGFQQPQGSSNARAMPSAGPGRPPRPVPVPHPDEPVQQKAKVPELEKHLLDQLSSEEQNALNKKFEEAKDAEKKVVELEKDILEAKQKVQFYHAKMQELVLYKSRCDNRLNEISEKVVGDKREAELLAKKYEEKYMQVGDVASKLTIEEATFRDIQEKKMELYRAIVKLDQGNADGAQDRANQVQSDLEELVKALNERCKTYGLRAKPTSLLELPFGWQPGIEGTAADWDEDWDKFEDEGFTYVKELTLEVQNVIAPPKLKSAFREKVSSFHNSTTGKSPFKADNNSELPSSVERVTEDDRLETNNSEHTARTPPDSPAGNNAVASPSKEFRDLRMNKDFNMNGSPYAFDNQSEYGAESIFSGDKRFDDQSWGTFDSHYDADAAWDSVSVASKEAGSLFGPDDWGLNPIKTGARGTDASLPRQGAFFDSVPSTPSNTGLPKQGSFFDSVPSTPSNVPSQKQGPFFDSVPSTPLYNLSSPHADNLFARNSLFADSVPTTPMYNFSSPKNFSEGLEEQHSFDSFSRFDSFNMQDSGPFSSRESFTRFDSMRSTRDSTDFDQGYFAQPETLTRFDSFRSTADSDYNFGAFPPQASMTRFDSMSSSTQDADYGHGFDDTADPFGSDEPFRSSREAQTPSRDSGSWKAF
ncbi:epidermal growth factor receptor substrate 15-like 1 [Salvia splendens]|uniref:epidermal growth factor receptor substrate 15-like 1 n=1 Tax=Salvia splendens TaxID=180675 RepID=UPI001C260B29|nr:epidermal growth factor receptor substrate 15-like 1 [Salvia splendens]